MLFAGGKVYWTPNGVMVSTHSGVAGLSDDMKGGAFVFAVYAESIVVIRVDRNGNLPWGLQGRVVAGYAGYQGGLTGVSDCAGGVIGVWCKDFPQKLFCQRVDSLGNRMWGLNAQRVTLSDSAQGCPAVVSDGAKGIIVVWQESRVDARGWDIYAQRIDSNGVRRWGDYGVAVCAADSSQEFPAITCDNRGNSVITWNDYRNGDYDVYGQRLDGNGTPSWQVNGIAICDTIDAQGGSSVIIASDTTIIVSWSDRRNGDYDIYAQKLTTDGLPLWVSNGQVVCDTINLQGGGLLIADTEGGAIVCWLDERNGFKNIYAQRIDANGNKLWTNQGVPICNTNSAYWDYRIVTDGRSGAIICWQDNRSGNWDIYAQHIDSLGNILWETNGMPVCTVVDPYERYPEMIVSDSGRAIICWTDYRSGQARGYAQKVGDEVIGISETWAVGRTRQGKIMAVHPNPFTKLTTVSFGMGHSAKGIELKIYDISGRVVRDFTNNLESGILNQVSSVIWDGRDDGGERLPGGVYFCNLEVGSYRLTQKMILLR